MDLKKEFTCIHIQFLFFYLNLLNTVFFILVFLDESDSLQKP